MLERIQKHQSLSAESLIWLFLTIISRFVFNHYQYQGNQAGESFQGKSPEYPLYQKENLYLIPILGLKKSISCGKALVSMGLEVPLAARKILTKDQVTLSTIKGKIPENTGRCGNSRNFGKGSHSKCLKSTKGAIFEQSFFLSGRMMAAVNQ